MDLLPYTRFLRLTAVHGYPKWFYSSSVIIFCLLYQTWSIEPQFCWGSAMLRVIYVAGQLSWGVSYVGCQTQQCCFKMGDIFQNGLLSLHTLLRLITVVGYTKWFYSSSVLNVMPLSQTWDTKPQLYCGSAMLLTNYVVSPLWWLAMFGVVRSITIEYSTPRWETYSKLVW